MNPDQRRKTRTMAAMLQLADALDRPRDGSVQRVLTADTGESLLIRTFGASVEPDREAMQGRIDYAQAVLGRRIEFVT
jgi:carbonic anhydrase